MHTARFDKNAYECSLKLTDKHFSLFVYASRPWYKRAVANPPDILALASVYLDGGGVGKVVTLAQTVFEGKPNQPSDCTAATNKPGGCPCSSSSVCKSQHCYDNSCANHQVREIPIFVSLFGFLTPAAVCVCVCCCVNNPSTRHNFTRDKLRGCTPTLFKTHKQREQPREEREVLRKTNGRAHPRPL